MKLGPLRGPIDEARNASRRFRHRLARVPSNVRGLISTPQSILLPILVAIREQRLSTRPSLRLGVDIRPFYEPLTGVGWYLHALLTELAKEPDLELVYFGASLIDGESPRLHVELPPGRLVAFHFRESGPGRWAAFLARALFPVLISAQKCDVLFGPNYFLPGPMAATAGKRVVTIHDLTFRRHPEMLQQETLDNLNREMKRELFRADAAICVSRATRRDLLEFFDIDPARAIAIHSGVPPVSNSRTPVPGLPARFVLFVSTIEPRKNLTTLIRAFDLLRRQHGYQGSLVIVGRIGWKAGAVLEEMKRSQSSPSIVHLDYLDRSQLNEVYSRAEVFVFPSWYEGFGFPLLEAMAHGVPTIAARSSSLPEIGGQAASYFNPGSVDQLVEQLSRVISDPELRQRMIREGHTQVRKFQWSNTARQTLDVFRRVARSDL